MAHNIVWKNNNGTYAVTNLSPATTDLSTHVQFLIESKIIPTAEIYGYDISGDELDKLLSVTTPDRIKQKIVDAITKLLDTKAQTHQYDNISSAISYISSSNAKFASEARIFSDWRDAVWSAWFAIEPTITSTTDVSTTIDSLPHLPI